MAETFRVLGGDSGKDQHRTAETRCGPRTIAGQTDRARTAAQSIEGSAREAVENHYDPFESDDAREAGCGASVRGSRCRMDSFLRRAPAQRGSRHRPFVFWNCA